jgi:hypothetical protein
MPCQLRNSELSSFGPATIIKNTILVSKGTQLHYKTNHLILYREILAVEFENDTKRSNTLCGKNAKYAGVTVATVV